MIECIVIILYENTPFQISRSIKELNSIVKNNKILDFIAFYIIILLIGGINLN